MSQKTVAASYLLLQRDRKILLLRRFNTGFEDGKYSLIAGHVESEETFSDCIIRESKEEVGITIAGDDIQVVHVMHRNSGLSENNERIDVFFKAENWTGEVKNLEPNKCDDLSWFSLDNLPSNIIPYIRNSIQCVLEGICYSEHGWK